MMQQPVDPVFNSPGEPGYKWCHTGKIEPVPPDWKVSLDGEQKLLRLLNVDAATKQSLATRVNQSTLMYHLTQLGNGTSVNLLQLGLSQNPAD